jgi:hypothetical protein
MMYNIKVTGNKIFENHRAANIIEFSLNFLSDVFALSIDGDLSNTKSACALPA